ncbi:MAG: branched-chain amino acid aminotransferase [Gammaproteobacteria bacterium]|nr:branched-chain amino acid aminotransferase [Gammaproteobacteria bacterium]
MQVTRVARSRLAEVDFDNLGFGDVYADHMFTMTYADGVWSVPGIEPFGPIAVHPANSALHYGQAVFEGLKAFRGVDGRIRLFRADMNARRLVESCDRLCIPRIDPDVFLRAVERLVAVDHRWVPRSAGQSLYVRPIVFSDEGHLEVRPANRYRFVIFTSPVRAYFDTGVGPVSLLAEESYTRSAPGGVGYAKTAGNYAASLYPGQRGRDAGYAQVLWLDGVEHRYVEEVGAMNIFFRFEDRVVTPDLRGTILPGVTRASVIDLLRAAGHQVEERRVSIDEITEGARSGRLREAFAAGTAAVIAPVGRIGYKGTDHTLGNEQTGELTRWLYEQLTGIQRGEIADPDGWCRLVTPQPGD